MLCYMLWDEHNNGEGVWWGGLHFISWKALKFSILKMKSCASALDWTGGFLLLSTFEMKIFRTLETKLLEFFIVCKQYFILVFDILNFTYAKSKCWHTLLLDWKFEIWLMLGWHVVSYSDPTRRVKCLLYYVFIYTSHCCTGQRRLYSSGKGIAS